MTSQKSSWRQAAVYQIYPWSFNEDEGRQPQKGHGSIKGIAEKIPYLREEVGIDAIWLSPFYPSPMKDGGYDISDLKDVHPDLGTIDDFDELVRVAHHHGVKLMADFVPNHTSDQHEWFQKSRKRDGYEDWYIWHPGHVDENGERQVPNNWASVFSMPNRQARDRGEMPWLHHDEWTPPVSQWEWDDERQEYYLHSFAKEQPDLNWSNPFVREAMKDAMRFWLDHGVDGFRVDAVNHIGKNMKLPNEEVNTAYNEQWNENPYDQLLRYNSADYPEALHSYIWEMAQVLKDEKYEDRDLRMVLEAYVGESELRDMDAIAPGVASTFNFGRFYIDWSASHQKIQIDYYYSRLQKTAVGNQVNGNHDKTRVATRLGEDFARTAAIMNLFLPGMRFIYNGEELNLRDAKIPYERLQDPYGGRDPERTPMIWDTDMPNGGFSNVAPEDLWLPVNEEDLDRSVASQRAQPKSTLSLFREALKLCHKLDAVQRGSYVSMHTDNDNVLAYSRRTDDDTVVVLTNFTRETQHVKVFDTDFVIAESILSSNNVREDLGRVDIRSGITLEPAEALVIIPA
ncbi:MAG: alpha amylase, alpha-glucosidase [Candidatus Saccharibacteria bacterium]|nr:alpha amylase, alpha-glucosidase [Candidatus Saccharibacteria bacterium]